MSRAAQYTAVFVIGLIVGACLALAALWPLETLAAGSVVGTALTIASRYERVQP